MRRTVMVAALIALTLNVSACGSDGKSGDAATSDEQKRQQAALDFSQCMRDNGVNMPDPQFSADGGAMMRIGPGDGLDPEDPKFQEAEKKCEDKLKDVIGDGPDIDPERQKEMQESLLAYSQCMRDNGVNMPDPEFGEGGRVTRRLDGNDGDIDPESSEFREAEKVCRDKHPMGAPMDAGSR